uniref:Uncharacterized protein n=1 Tax=Malurus cyaneus samueli TaxID=2593467 RepID=A0A8C5UCA3_9PASS
SSFGLSYTTFPTTSFERKKETLGHLNYKITFETFFPVWPEFCGRTLSWPAGHCPGPQSQWNPAPAAAWSASPPGAGRIYLSFSPQIHPPLLPAAQPRP